MKRCPECGREYDLSMSFCLDDGAELLYGPASMDEPATAVLPGGHLRSEAPTKSQIKKGELTTILPLDGEHTSRTGIQKKRWALVALIGALLISGVFLAYRYRLLGVTGSDLGTADPPATTPILYWQMTEGEQLGFIQDRAQYVQGLIGDEQRDPLDQEALSAIKEQIDYYIERKDSLLQKPFEEGLRTIYGRATQYAPMVIQSYEERKVPPALGLYQAMIESEYHDCPTVHSHLRAPVGLFQFSRKTAAGYGLTPADYCDVQKQSNAAARHMSDLISDFGGEKASWTLALFSFDSGGDQVRDFLRQLRSRGVTERSFWAVFRHKEDLQPPLQSRYVTRFFAAAIIGESPGTFELPTPPLSTLRK